MGYMAFTLIRALTRLHIGQISSLLRFLGWFGFRDTHLDRPTVVSVLRTESDRVPQVLVSQASTELRRTR
ncbi:hypothetical protein ANCDUO_06869 [Ancylostoma duodenale]|uniref:Uncharacterized protein n=1 Tax=Ancylostoma duodenale TaxID=51022 RepID=A0A0C2H0K7_9BILA|nr:hypothetical protein ANCDUO_06869 [Ancylostoma duodenale]